MDQPNTTAMPPAPQTTENSAPRHTEPSQAHQTQVYAQQPAPPQMPQPPFYPPVQQGGYSAPLYTAQPPQPVYPVPQVSKRESFIGINLLSKIGVIFIIIGVIAFSAVSEDFLAPGIRTAIIFALGLLMTGLGEVFYRTSSVIFARALTIGGIGELAVSILIGHFEYEALNEIFSLIICVVLAAGSLLLSVRYNSQTIMAVSAVSGFIPCFASIHSEAAMFATMLYLLLFQAATLIICGKKHWYITPFLLIFSNFIISIAMYAAMQHMFDDVASGLIATAYVVVSTFIPIVCSLVNSLRNAGSLNTFDTVSFISSAVIQLLLSFIFLAISDTIIGFGFLALFVGCAYLAVSAVAKTTFDRCPLLTALLNSAFICLCCAIPCIFPTELIYVMFHLYAAALFIFGSLKESKLVRTWGIVTCAAAEYFFVNFCLLNIADDIYILQFGINALLWLVIMTVQVLCGKRGAGLTAYSILSILNAVIYLLYLILRLIVLLEDEAVLLTAGESIAIFMLFAAFVWIAAGFIVGKLRFLGKAAPATSIVFYALSLSGLGITNLVSCISSPAANTLCMVTSIAVNLLSVAAVLDITLTVSALSPKFAKFTGLIVSMYALFCATFTLGANEIVAFTNCIISIIYLAAAIVWIIWGFVRRNAVLRRFGLALALLASAKLFLLDFMGINAVGRTLMFISFGVVLLVLSFIYAIFESRLKKQTLAEQQQEYQRQMQLYQQQLQQYQQYQQQIQYQQQQMAYTNASNDPNNIQQ